MSARDVIAAAIWLYEREIAGAPLPHPSWETFKENDPETAMVYETHAASVDAALRAAGYAVERDWQDISTAPRDGTRFWGKVGDDALSMLWHPTFDAFVSSWRRMEMAPGYTFADTGLGYRDHSPDKHNPTHWRPLPAPPG